jgi:diguanylate cyclase (GGDEF)-like protein/PAS domain S-box-containing protein
MKLLRLSITSRLWLGLGMLLAVFAAAALVSLRATHELDDTLAHLVTEGDARTGAAYEMNLHLDAIARALDSYLDVPEAVQRDRIKTAQGKFEQALQDYKGLTSEAEGRSIAQHLTEAYGRYRKQTDEVIRLNESQMSRLAAYDARRRDVASLLGSIPEPAWSPRGAPPAQKRAAVQGASEALQHTPSASDLRADDADDRVETARRAFADALSQYQKFADAPAEQEWAQRAQRWNAELLRQSAAIFSSQQALERARTRLQSVRRRLDEVLESSVQPAAKAELKAAMDKASGTAHRANVLITRGLLLALALGVLAAVLIGRAVKSPLAALVASSRRLAEGEFSHRVPIPGSDELGKLTEAFNEMAARLQSTTVSRTYMESVVHSMSEALLVVADGVIRMANTAATRLLGYQPGELNGKPMSEIISEPDVDWRRLPPRFTIDFHAKDGTLIPVSVSAVPMPARAEYGAAMVCVARDLRERIAAEQHQRRTAVVFENTKEGIVLTDAERNVVMVNPAFTEITGYTREAILGQRADVLWAAKPEGPAGEVVWESLQKQEQWQGESWIRRQDGELRPVWNNISVVQNASGRVVNYVSVFSDISAIKDAEERLSYLAYHDPLTDLPNRLLLADRIRTAMSRAERTGTSVALLYLDLDDFKHVNDTLGHEKGDLLLNEIALRLREHVRGEDSVARLGGDEFVVVLEDVADPAQPARLAEKLLASIAEPAQLAGYELRMRASIGISLGPKHGVTSEELLKAADAAMYRAKRGGRGRYEFFSAELTRMAAERLTLENAMRDPRIFDQLVLLYQPQVEVATSRLVGAEALIRWRHPTRGLLDPSVFVPMAEEAGLMPSLGAWALLSACRQVKAWGQMGYPGVRMAVNVSAYQIKTLNIVESVRSALAETGLQPDLLELEVTEGALQTGDGAPDILNRLKSLGVCLALDDFGTGYSALSSLKLLPFDRLKIDRSFMVDVAHDADSRALARAIIAMARSLNLEIIAEGIETAEQLAFLRAEGCDEMQGYLTGAPMTADEFAVELQAHAAGLPARKTGQVADSVKNP